MHFKKSFNTGNYIRVQEMVSLIDPFHLFLNCFNYKVFPKLSLLQQNNVYTNSTAEVLNLLCEFYFDCSIF